MRPWLAGILHLQKTEVALVFQMLNHLYQILPGHDFITAGAGNYTLGLHPWPQLFLG
jgi:hypothetical protein